jgi:hypothetical protein
MVSHRTNKKRLAIGLAHKQTVLTELNSELAACERYFTDIAMEIWETEVSEHEVTNKLKQPTIRTNQIWTSWIRKSQSIDKQSHNGQTYKTGVRHALALRRKFNWRIVFATKSFRTCETKLAWETYACKDKLVHGLLLTHRERNYPDPSS